MELMFKELQKLNEERRDAKREKGPLTETTDLDRKISKLRAEIIGD